VSRRGVRIGITGGIACGKSEVGRVLRRRGVPVLDADSVARAAMRPGRPAYRSVVRRFGPSILGRGGAIDRAALGRIVFADDAARGELNASVHPAVFRELVRWMDEATRRGSAAAAIVPLLFETGAEKHFDVVVCVGSSRRDVVARLRARGLSAREAARRIRAQMPLREKRKRADVFIENHGTLADLARTTRRALTECIEKEKE
jgi:dephospho-CoA kinase